MNNDGKSPSFREPNPIAQEENIKSALADARITTDAIDYIEAHGTGTPLGDPIEIKVIKNVFSKDRPKDKPVLIGAVKTNIGHMEAACGFASLFKVILALNNEKIPGIMHFNSINPRIDSSGIKIVTENMDWPRTNRKRRALISAYGYTGTNAHAVIEEAPVIPRRNIEREMNIFSLSAKTRRDLKELTGRYLTYLEKTDDKSIYDICYTANTGRVKLNCAFAINIGSKTELMTNLKKESLKIETRDFSISGIKSVFLFTGMGAHYAVMGKSLYKYHEAFRTSFDKFDKLYTDFLNISLKSVLWGENKKLLSETKYLLPAIFSLEVSFYDLLHTLNIKPTCVLGHSIGEYAVACVAGVFSIEEGFFLVLTKASLITEHTKQGKMAVVFSSFKEVKKYIADGAYKVDIAADNGPNIVVISGLADQVDAFTSMMEIKEVKTRNLSGMHASHSCLMDPVLEKFLKVAEKIEYKKPKIKYISSLYGRECSEEIACGKYWVEHLRNPVDFQNSIKATLKLNINTFIEIGPEKTLVSMVRSSIIDSSLNFLTPLSAGDNELSAFYSFIADMHNKGVLIDYDNFYKGFEGVKVLLPNYSFNRKKYWLEPNEVYFKTASQDVPKERNLKLLNTRKSLRFPLLGSLIEKKGDELVFQSIINRNCPDFLAHHVIRGKTIFPTTGYIEIALRAGSEIYNLERLEIYNFEIRKALLIENEDVLLRTIIKKEGDILSIRILSIGSKSETLHAIGYIRKLGENEDDIYKYRRRLNASDNELSIAKFYEDLTIRGLYYGETFRGVKKLYFKGSECFAVLKAPYQIRENFNSFVAHPVLIDSASHSGTPLLEDTEALYIPVHIQSLKVYRRLKEECFCHVRKSSNTTVSGSLRALNYTIFNDNHQKIIEITGYQKLRIKDQEFGGQEDHVAVPPSDEMFYKIDWIVEKKGTFKDKRDEIQKFYIFNNNSNAGKSLLKVLKKKGINATLLKPEYKRKIDQALTKGLFYGVNNNNRFGIVYFADFKFNEEDGYHINPDCLNLIKLIKTIKERGIIKNVDLYLITCGVHNVLGNDISLSGLYQSPFFGLGRVIFNEYRSLNCNLIDIDPNAGNFENAMTLLKEFQFEQTKEQVALRRKKRFIARLNKIQKQKSDRDVYNSENSKVILTEYGSFDNLKTVVLKREKPGDNEVEIDIRAAGLNFKETLYVSGLLTDYLKAQNITHPSKIPFGFECAGIIKRVGRSVKDFKEGDRVFAYTRNSFSSYLNVDSKFVFKIPYNLSFEQSASFPVVFTTTIYALIHLAGIKKGDSIFIQAAAGGIGQAAVEIAKSRGATIYASASRRKWDHLKSQGIENIVNSRSLDYKDDILKLTNNRGVDIVLNSFTGEHIKNCFDILKKGGVFIELGKRDVWTKEEVFRYRPDVKYHNFDMRDMIGKQPELLKTLMHELISNITDNIIKPIPYKTYDLKDIKEAFRALAGGKSIGKLIMKMPGKTNKKTHSVFKIDSEKAYLITGGAGALGMKFARLLIDQGARHIVLTSRGEHYKKVFDFQKSLNIRDIQIDFEQRDISKIKDVHALINEFGEKYPQLGGIIHAAGIVKDGIIENITDDMLLDTAKPKIIGSLHLHNCTKELNLDFFILFSSIASVLGSSGQGAYASSNMFMDILAHYRRIKGLCATSINWGPWTERGMAASLDERSKQRKKRLGIHFINDRQGCYAFLAVMKKDIPQCLVCHMDIEKYKLQYGNNKTPGILNTQEEILRGPVDAGGDRIITKEKGGVLMNLRQKKILIITDLILNENDPEMVSALTDRLSKLKKRGDASNDRDYEEKDINLKTVGEPLLDEKQIKRQNKIASIDKITDIICKVTGIDKSDIDAKKPLSLYGIDSLLSVDLISTLSKEFSIELPADFIETNNTIKNIDDFLSNA